MNKYIIPFVLSSLSLLGSSCGIKNQEKANKLTAINPLSYTSVVYSSGKDTVFVSTYSGRIAQRINTDPSEKIIVNIDDEIYALAYVRDQNTILASTLNSGILAINAKTGKIIKSIPINNSWAISLSVTKNEKYLFTSALDEKSYIWDIAKNYEQVDLPESLAKSVLRGSDDSNKFYFTSKGKALVWNLDQNKIEKELSIGFNKLVDIDNQGHILLLNHHEALLYDMKTDSIRFNVSHPSWLYLDSDDKLLGEIPLSMKLTKGKLADNRIFTAGIDRSLRVWSSKGGELLESWTGHHGTISDVKVNGDQSQLVSVDLKGIIKFWDLR